MTCSILFFPLVSSSQDFVLLQNCFSESSKESRSTKILQNLELEMLSTKFTEQTYQLEIKQAFYLGKGNFTMSKNPSPLSTGLQRRVLGRPERENSTWIDFIWLQKLRKNFFIHPVCICNSNFRKLLLKNFLSFKNSKGFISLRRVNYSLLVSKYMNFLLNFQVQTPEYLYNFSSSPFIFPGGPILKYLW